MSNKLIVKSEITINAPLQKVWNVLTKPEETKKYMYGCETVSDWKVGSELLWRGSYEGKEMVFVKGKIVEIKPPSLLKYTVIDPNASYPDIPANYLNVIYELSAQSNQTKLVVLQDGFEGAAEGEKRYTDTYNKGEGWNPILVQIKKIAEEN